MSVTREDIAYAKQQVRYARQVLRERQERLRTLRQDLAAQEAPQASEHQWVPTHRSLRDSSEVRCVGISKSEMTLVLQNENGDEWPDIASEWETIENVPCVVCGRTDLPLHTDHQCPECHVVDEEEGFALDYGFGGDR